MHSKLHREGVIQLRAALVGSSLPLAKPSRNNSRALQVMFLQYNVIRGIQCGGSNPCSNRGVRIVLMNVGDAQQQDHSYQPSRSGFVG